MKMLLLAAVGLTVLAANQGEAIGPQIMHDPGPPQGQTPTPPVMHDPGPGNQGGAIGPKTMHDPGTPRGGAAGPKSDAGRPQPPVTSGEGQQGRR